MLDLLTISVILGSLAPLIVSLIKKTTWSTQAKQWLVVGISAVLALVSVAAADGWAGFNFGSFEAWQAVVASMGTIFALAQTSYNGFWKGTAPEEALKAVGN